MGYSSLWHEKRKKIYIFFKISKIIFKFFETKLVPHFHWLTRKFIYWIFVYVTFLMYTHSRLSIKYIQSDFLISNPSSPCACIYAFSLQPILPSTSVWIIFSKDDLTDIFCELLSFKGPQTMLQNEETTVQSYQKIFSLKTKKSPGDQGCAF